MRIEGDRAAAVGAALRWVGHPGTVAAVVVLAVNDHVGKQAWPGWVTGKLSDLVWMVVSPPVLALLLTLVLRLRGDWPAVVGIGGTALSFALAKATPVGADVVSQLWSLSGVPSRTVCDPTDLLVLPALAVAWWLWRGSRRPWRGWQALALVAVPAAVAAMVATSASYPDMRLWGEDGRPVLQTFQGRWTSTDGGLTWIAVKPGTGGSEHREVGPAELGRCAPGDPLHCYRLLDTRSPVEASQDGGATWAPAFTPSWLAPRGEAGTGQGGAAGGGELLVVALPGGGHGVVVNYRGYDLVVRKADGTWAETYYPQLPPAQWDWSPGRGLPLAGAVGWAAFVAGLGVRLLRAAPAGRRLRLGLALTARQVLVLSLAVLVAWLCGCWTVWSVPGWLAASMVLMVLPVLLLVWPGSRAVPDRVPGAVGGAAGVVALAVLAWFMLRSLGGGPAELAHTSRTALYLAPVATLLGVLVGALAPEDRGPRAGPWQ